MRMMRESNAGTGIEMDYYQRNYIMNCVRRDIESEMETQSRLKSLGIKSAMRTSRRKDSEFDARDFKGLEDDGPRPFEHGIDSVMRRARAGDPDGGWNNNVGSWN